MFPNLLSDLVNDEILAERRRRAPAVRLSQAAVSSRPAGQGFPGQFFARLAALFEGIRIRRAPEIQAGLICSDLLICCPAGSGGCQK